MNKSCTVVSDSLSALPDLLPAGRRVIAVVDRNVGHLYHDIIPTAERIFIDAGESFKNLAVVAYIVDRLLEMEADRNILLLGIGGGITTDITGFTASVYKRGVQFAYLPTTLLAMVDAATGGKTGVNHIGYKNIIGTFSLPSFTLCDTEFLKTLPSREFRCGVAELIKTLLISDAGAYCSAVEYFAETNEIESGLTELIKKAVGVKEDIVARDFRDTGERMKLNLGHTFGHAIEKCAAQTGSDITHGEAVAAGILISARLSEKLGYAPKGLYDRIEGDFMRMRLHTELPFGMNDVYTALRNDKKRDGDFINFVFIMDIGHVVVEKIRMEDVRL